MIILSDVLTALSSSLWGVKICKLKLVSKYLSTIQEKKKLDESRFFSSVWEVA